MRKWTDISFEIGSGVYLKTDKDQSKRIVTAIAIKPTGVTYELSYGTMTSWHYDFEISSDVDVVAKVTYSND
jgi:hypothetical protein